MKILLATHNPAKIKDYHNILSKRGFKIETLSSLGIVEKFEEKQMTFEDNSRMKALFYYNLTKLPTFAEDGGFVIDYFNGEPGVKSRRWPGHEATDQELVSFLQGKVKEIPQNKRTARFIATLCLVKSVTDLYFATNTIEGYLVDEVRNDFPLGYPYRSLFKERTFNKYLMDLTEEEYNQINHRRKNIDELIKYLN